MLRSKSHEHTPVNFVLHNTSDPASHQMSGGLGAGLRFGRDRLALEALAEDSRIQIFIES